MIAKQLVEIRSYKLKPGSGAAFHRAFSGDGIPLVRETGMDVVAFGHSAHDPDGYYLIRAFDSLEHRETSQNAFYSSDAWRMGPREAIVGHIETYVDTVVWLSEAALTELRASLAASP